MAQNVTGKLYKSIIGYLFEIVRQLCQEGGYPFDPKMLQKHLQLAVEGRFATGCNVSDKANKNILRLISGDKILTIDAVDGTETLASAEKLFSYVDHNFIEYKANRRGPATKKTPVKVYTLTQKVTFPQMFNEFHTDDIKRLFFTQHQIKNFITKHRKWLQEEGYGTLFPLISQDNLFIVRVIFIPGVDLRVRLYRLFGKDPEIWKTDYPAILMVPKLTVIS